jgi:hypothetical protein
VVTHRLPLIKKWINPSISAAFSPSQELAVEGDAALLGAAAGLRARCRHMAAGGPPNLTFLQGSSLMVLRPAIGTSGPVWKRLLGEVSLHSLLLLLLGLPGFPVATGSSMYGTVWTLRGLL